MKLTAVEIVIKMVAYCFPRINLKEPKVGRRILEI